MYFFDNFWSVISAVSGPFFFRFFCALCKSKMEDSSTEIEDPFNGFERDVDDVNDEHVGANSGPIDIRSRLDSVSDVSSVYTSDLSCADTYLC